MAERCVERSDWQGAPKYVYVYEFDDSDMSSLRVKRFTAAVDWEFAKFVMANRQSRTRESEHNRDNRYDIVAGPIADDKMGVLFRRFEDGEVSLEYLIGELKFKKGADGTVTPLKKGTTKITITTHNKKKTTLKLTVKNTGTVDPGTPQTGTLCLTIPARTTGIDGIAGNLAMINDIKNSTLGEISRLQSAGTLSAESAARRREIVENIFANYAFPWMTPSLQKYCKAANSENGAKDFKPDVVYYGMPYISGSGANRRYSAALAVSEGRYTDSGLGYYVLNKSNYLNGKYVGNDCSGLVNVSIWGTGSSHSADRTDDINKTSAYKTISDYGAMLPGDLICKSNAHVIMFLYYANEDKSTFMMIENGGSEAGTNTVHCDIKTVAGFKKSGYKVRRLAGL